MSQSKLSGVHKVGAVCGIGSGVILLILTALFVVLPTNYGLGTRELLDRIADQRAVFAAQNGFALILDILVVPFTLSLYLALRESRRAHALTAAVLAVLGSVVGLAATILNYSLVRLSRDILDSKLFSGPTLVAVAEMIRSTTNVGFATQFFLYAIATIIISLAMLSSVFSKRVAWLGVATGILVIVASIPSVLGIGLITQVIDVLYAFWFFGVSGTLLKVSKE